MVSSEQTWEEQLFANPDLGPGYKLLLWALYPLVAHADGKMVHIPYDRIAEVIGMSTDTVGRNLKALADRGVLLREVRNARERSGLFRTESLIGWTGWLAVPGLIKLK